MINPKPETRNPKPQTPNPNPMALRRPLGDLGLGFGDAGFNAEGRWGIRGSDGFRV